MFYTFDSRVCTVYCEHIQPSLPSFSSPYTAPSLFQSSSPPPLTSFFFLFSTLLPSISPHHLLPFHFFPSPFPSLRLSLSRSFFSFPALCRQLPVLCFSIYNADAIRRRRHPSKLSTIPGCQQSSHPSSLMFLGPPNGWHRYCV